VKAIVASGYFEDPVLAHHKEYGFCAVVTKPFRLQQLAHSLQGVIDGR